jgi:hypothetical protein
VPGQRDDPRRRQRHRRVGEAGEQRTEPPGLRDHVGVEERDERRARGREPRVAGRGGAPRLRVAHERRSRPLRDRPDARGVRGTVVDDDRGAEVRGQRGEQPGEPVDAVLHRHDDGDVRRGRDRSHRLGRRVRDARVEQPARELRRHRVADLERAVLETGRRGGGQPQHPRRGAPEEGGAVVDDDRVPVEHDPHPVRQRLVHGHEPKP